MDIAIDGTLAEGVVRCLLIHADGSSGEARIRSFIVGIGVFAERICAVVIGSRAAASCPSGKHVIAIFRC